MPETPFVQSDFSLKTYNTFGLDVKAAWFTEVFSAEALRLLLKTPECKDGNYMVLGGGSNVLFTRDFDGLVIKNSIKGIEIVKEEAEAVLVKAGAGEVWHQFVLYCLEHDFAGAENLSLIPGTVGAAPMQNIGAYGVEIKDIFESLEALDVLTGETRVFTTDKCHFGYRESVFKTVYKNRYVIVSVTFRLSKKPLFKVSYGAIQKVLEEKGVKALSIMAISDAVIEIRSSKLPDPAILGNAGSFFKNPEISLEKLEKLKEIYPEIPNYPLSDSSVKLAAGWLIEQCGWKGKKVGHTGAHKDQALVLVNYGEATGTEIWNLALEIQKSVWDKFEVEIIPEVNII